MDCVCISGLTVRSVCWARDRVLAGTKDSEVYEIVVQDQNNPQVLVGGHAEGELWALAVHPRRDVVASGSDDKTIRVWEIAEHQMVASCSTACAVRSLAYSPDGSQLAAGMQDGGFSVYSAQ